MAGGVSRTREGVCLRGSERALLEAGLLALKQDLLTMLLKQPLTLHHICKPNLQMLIPLCFKKQSPQGFLFNDTKSMYSNLQL